MKRLITHIICMAMLALSAGACVMDEPTFSAEPETGGRGGAVTRIVIPGGGGTTGVNEENMSVETVRFLVFDATGTCVAKTDALPVTADDVTIDYNPPAETHHPAQYVITVETGLEIDRLMSGNSTYTVYAILNEKMGGSEGNNRYTGVSSTNISSGLNNVNSRDQLISLMKQPLPFTFNVDNSLPGTDPSDASKPFQEPAFIMCGSTDFVYQSTMETIPTITINNQGLDRTMAKVTIESISSGDDSSEKASRLFVTGVKLVNIPRNVYIDADVKPTSLDDMTVCDLDNGEDDSFGSVTDNGYFKRQWDGMFHINTQVDVTLKQEFQGIFYQNDKDGTALGKNNYTPFPWDYSEEWYENGKIQSYGKFFDFDGVFRGPASLFPTPNKSLELNQGNYLSWLKALGPDLDDATDPTLDSWNPTSTYTTTEAKWDMQFSRSYYIPENLYSNSNEKEGYPCIEVTVAKGMPYIPERAPEEILQYILDHWDEYKDKGEWQGSLDAVIKAQPVKVPAGTKLPGPPSNPEGGETLNQDMYYYVFKSEGYYKLTNIPDLKLDPIDSKDFFLDMEGADASPTVKFYIPIAEGYEVHRNHEYRLKLVVNSTTFDAIPDNAANLQYATRTAGSKSGSEVWGITVERQVTALK